MLRIRFFAHTVMHTVRHDVLPAIQRFFSAAAGDLPARRRQFGFFSLLSNGVLILSLSGLGAIASLEQPPYKRYAIENTVRSAAKRPLVLIGADGEPFAVRGDCVAESVTLEELPRHLIQAVISMEDRRFYSHFGVDPVGILRAAIRNYQAGRTVEGGSTITQQLAKMSFLSRDKTMARKAEEALVAILLEFRLTKNEILERYLSSAYFGDGCYGVRAAAKHFFGKAIADLTLNESALLVALLRSPTELSRNLDAARQRASLVIQAMARDGALTSEQLQNLAPVEVRAVRRHEPGGYYADWLANILQNEIDEPHARQPLRVHTTFDATLQHLALEAVRSTLEKLGERHNAGQAALVAMRPDGRVLAMVGGRDREISRFNRAVQARRQPGSAFKTFVYLAAFRAGIDPHMLLSDEPISIGGWEPKNYSKGYRGTVTLTKAFASSINSVAIKLSEAVGRDAVIETAQDLGISSPLVPNPSLALGTSEVNLLELTSAYAAIAAGAYPVKPWGVAGLSGEPSDGGRPPQDAGLWALEGADEIRALLSSVVRHGTGRDARLPVASFGKTGTSQDYRDAWFIGYAGNLVVGVWVGNDDFTPMKRVTGGSLPARIWRSFMRDALKADPAFERKPPQIAYFRAEPKSRGDASARLAALEALNASDPEPVETVSYGHQMTGAEYYQRRREPPRIERRTYDQPRRRTTTSRAFQQRLNDMNWPGQ